MLVIMKNDSTELEIQKVVQTIEAQGFKSHIIPGECRLAIGITGNRSAIDEGLFRQLSGVQETLRVTKPYKLVSRDFYNEDTVIKIGDVAIGGGSRVVMAGPCAVESYEQALRIAIKVKESGAKILRAGAFKPRTSPYSFQGLGEEGLKILQVVSKETGMPVISEAIDLPSLEMVEKYADIVQIGARNMQNFSLLQAVGKIDKPVMLKRGPSATVDEVLCSAEYILQNGNQKVMICERGLRGFDKHTRNLLDIAFVPVMKELTHLPIIVDPSHAVGRRNLIPPIAKASVAVGADGIMVEVHDRPQEALSDGDQSLLPDQFDELMSDLVM